MAQARLRVHLSPRTGIALEFHLRSQTNKSLKEWLSYDPQRTSDVRRRAGGRQIAASNPQRIHHHSSAEGTQDNSGSDTVSSVTFLQTSTVPIRIQSQQPLAHLPANPGNQTSDLDMDVLIVISVDIDEEDPKQSSVWFGLSQRNAT